MNGAISLLLLLVIMDLQESHICCTKCIISKVTLAERGNSKLKERHKSTAIYRIRTLEQNSVFLIILYIKNVNPMPDIDVWVEAA
jgi:hypothetical protein